MATDEKHVDDSYDVVIVGSGISGINAAYRIQQGLPHLSYAILENRDVIGGTWSFFKYPGFRSDSEIATFAFSWAPWDSETTIADGASILRYLETTASKHGIDKHILFNTCVTHLDWRPELQSWRLTTRVNSNTTKTFRARFVIAATGYYDYSTPLQTTIPGIDDFTGSKVHPQFWPSNLDHTDKNVVIIGSGATAVTLVPAMSKQAKHVTMLQRSPSYFLTMPAIDSIDVFTRKLLPVRLAYTVTRLRLLIIGFLFVQFCHLFPKSAAKILRAGARSELPPDYPLDRDFLPTYNPFEQRLCISPDGDFFQAIKDQKASIVTGKIESMKGNSIILQSGERIDNVDILVTATGLKLHLAGGINVTVKGEPIDISKKFVWRSSCLQDVPNLCYMFGYTDNAWTLGTDSSSRVFVRLIKRLEKEGGTSFVPDLSESEKKALKEVPTADLSSGYIQSAKHLIPRTASTQPWKPRFHYFWDWWFAEFGNMKKGMKIVRGPM